MKEKKKSSRYCHDFPAWSCGRPAVAQGAEKSWWPHLACCLPVFILSTGTTAEEFSLEPCVFFQNQSPVSCILWFTHDNNLIKEGVFAALSGIQLRERWLHPHRPPPQYLKQEFKNDPGIISAGNVHSELECVDSTQWIFYSRTEQGHLADSLLADAKASLPQVFCDLQIILGFKSGLDYSDENVTIHSGNTPTLNVTSVFPLFERFFKKKNEHNAPYYICAERK